MSRVEEIEERATRKVNLIWDDYQSYIQELLDNINDLQEQVDDLKDNVFNLTEQWKVLVKKRAENHNILK